MSFNTKAKWSQNNHAKTQWFQKLQNTWKVVSTALIASNCVICLTGESLWVHSLRIHVALSFKNWTLVWSSSVWGKSQESKTLDVGKYLWATPAWLFRTQGIWISVYCVFGFECENIEFECFDLIWFECGLDFDAWVWVRILSLSGVRPHFRGLGLSSVYFDFELKRSVGSNLCFGLWVWVCGVRVEWLNLYLISGCRLSSNYITQLVQFGKVERVHVWVWMCMTLARKTQHVPICQHV